MPTDTAPETKLVLDGALTMRTVDAVRATLRAAIEPASGSPRTAPAAVVIDCSGASEIDLTFIQLLIAARVSAGASGQTFSLAACPDGTLLDTLTRGGFQLEPDVGGGFWFRGQP